MTKINVILDSMNPTDSFIRKNERIKEALTNSGNASRIQHPTVKDAMNAIKRQYSYPIDLVE